MADKRFCTSCGAPTNPSNKVCTQCGFRFGNGAAPVAPAPCIPLRKDENNPPSPKTLPALVRQVIAGIIRNIRGMIKGMIAGMIVSFLIVLVLHTLLMMMLPGGSGPDDISGSILARAGLQSSPTAFLFWFLLTAIIAFLFAQVQSRGLKKVLDKIGSAPAWITGSARIAGITAVPLVMAGAAIALVIRMFFLTTLTSIQFLVLMLGVLYSQQESIAVLAMRLGYSDLNRLFRKTGPIIPEPGYPVMSVMGAAAGFLLVVFLPVTYLFIATVVVIVIGAIGVIISWKKRVHPAALTALTVLTRSSGGNR